MIRLFPNNIRFWFIPALFGAGMFFSCVNDMKEVQRVLELEKQPQETFEEVTLVYSDSGYTRAILETPVVYRYSQGKSRMEFPKGLALTFYKPGKVRESRLTANYGLLDQIERSLVVRNNVVFINFIRQDTLETEVLNWSQDSAMVFTEKLVMVHGNDGVFTCKKGLNAGEAFDWYEFKGVAVKYNPQAQE